MVVTWQHPHTLGCRNATCWDVFIYLAQRTRVHLETHTLVSLHVSSSRFQSKGCLLWITVGESASLICTGGPVPLTEKLCVHKNVAEGRLPHTEESQNVTCEEAFIHVAQKKRVHLEAITLISQHVSWSWFQSKASLLCKAELEQVTPLLYIGRPVPLTEKFCAQNKVCEWRIRHTFGYQNESCREAFIHRAQKARLHLETLTLSHHVPWAGFKVKAVCAGIPSWSVFFTYI